MKRNLLVALLLGLSFSVQGALAEWTTSKRITWTSGFSLAPAVAIDSKDAIHVVWMDNTTGSYDIYYRKSEDGGATWSPRQSIVQTSGDSIYPAIAIGSSGALHVVWYDQTYGYPEIYYKKSPDAGMTWNPAKRLTCTTSSWSEDPAIAIDTNDVVHVVWLDESPGNPDVFYRSSSDGGTTWTAARRLTWTSGNTATLSIVSASSETIYAAWGNGPPTEIYSKKSPDGGATWSFVTRLTWTSGSSWEPAMAADSKDTIHLVWRDETPGNPEIYYKHGQ